MVYRVLKALMNSMLKFTHWYNYVHKRSKLRFVTPYQSYTGQTKYNEPLEAAKAASPERWRKREVRNCVSIIVQDQFFCAVGVTETATPARDVDYIIHKSKWLSENPKLKLLFLPLYSIENCVMRCMKR